jgi:LuxR family maltose regulon positive regulatory protein
MIALLANRLDVLGARGCRCRVPGLSHSGPRAAAEGAGHRALELLEGLRAAGGRNLPRRIASLAEQVRLHARRFRAETCRTLCERIDAIIARDDVPQGRLWRRNVELLRQMARAGAAIAAQEWSGALEPLARANELAEAIGLGRVRIEIMGLRAFARSRRRRGGTAVARSVDLAKGWVWQPFATTPAGRMGGAWRGRRTA